MQAGLWQTLSAEILMALGGKKTDDFDTVLDKLCIDAWAEIEKQLLTDDTWWDAYASITISFSEVEALAKEEELRLVGGNLFALSIDVAFPIAEADGKRFVYAANNVVPTARCLNFTKFTWLPVILQVVADFLNSKDDSAARLKAIKKAESIWLTGLTTAYEKASRMSSLVALRVKR